MKGQGFVYLFEKLHCTHEYLFINESIFFFNKKQTQ